MRAHLIKASEFKAMPWKNGAGLTTQMAIEPEGATLESGFQWRLSMADVRSDGPFSVFPDCDRTLLLLKGKGMVLDFNGHGRKRLDTPLEPFRFEGDWHATGELIEGPCRDFNIIARKDLRHTVTVLRPEPRAVLTEAPTQLLYCLHGKARVTPPAQSLGQHDLLRLEDGGVLEISAEAPDTIVIAVAIG